ncbi:MAG: polysaccharide deacetylase family protein [Flavobacteriales bacterium]|jgi:hypothetical protein|nr:polysaccharide deacetylase family protein [Flavobacteriales bacterium]
MSLGAIFRQIIIAANQSSSYMKSRSLVYHDIHSDNCYTNMSTSLDMFIKHINIIREMGFKIVSEITKDEGQIQLTFDDGFLGIYDNISVINELDLPVKLFIITSFIGKPFHLDKNQLVELSNNPLITIGSHSHSHRRLNTLDKGELRYELTYSKKILEGLVGVPINDLCYPEGKFDKRVVKIARDVGYINQYSLIPGAFLTELFKNVRRRSLVQYANKKSFKSILKGGDDILERWYIKKHFKL